MFLYREAREKVAPSMDVEPHIAAGGDHFQHNLRNG